MAGRWAGLSAGNQQKEVGKVDGGIRKAMEQLEKRRENPIADGHFEKLDAHLDTLAERNKDYLQAMQSGTKVEQATAQKALNTALKDAEAGLKQSKSFLGGAKNFERWAALGKFGVGKAALVATAAVAGVAWLAGRRDDAARESRQSLREQRDQAMETQLNLGNSMPQLGANTMMGLEPNLNGAHGNAVLAARGGRKAIEPLPSFSLDNSGGVPNFT